MASFTLLDHLLACVPQSCLRRHSPESYSHSRIQLLNDQRVPLLPDEFDNDGRDSLEVDSLGFVRPFPDVPRIKPLYKHSLTRWDLFISWCTVSRRSNPNLISGPDHEDRPSKDHDLNDSEALFQRLPTLRPSISEQISSDLSSVANLALQGTELAGLREGGTVTNKKRLVARQAPLSKCKNDEQLRLDQIHETALSSDDESEWGPMEKGSPHPNIHLSHVQYQTWESVNNALPDLASETKNCIHSSPMRHSCGSLTFSSSSSSSEERVSQYKRKQKSSTLDARANTRASTSMDEIKNRAFESN